MLENFFTAIFLTVVIESIVALLFRRDKKMLTMVILINIATNPLLNYILLMINFLGLKINIILIILMEIIVVIVEWKVLFYSLVSYKSKYLLTLSITMNSVSFLVGILLNLL